MFSWMTRLAQKVLKLHGLKVAPTLRHAAKISIWASLFSSATQAQLTDQGPQLAASHSDQGERVNDIHT